MMKLLIPAIAAIIIGVGGGAGYAFMYSASEAPASVVADTTARLDSHSAALVHDSAGVMESDHSVHAEGEDTSSMAQHGEPLPLTPADSIRAMEKARAAMHEVKADPAAEQAKTMAAAQANAANAAQSIKTAASNASQTALPELRLAKIFGAMQAKDAARVLEQMSDTDIRLILALMSDRQAAAILSALPAARAATITRGSLPASTTP